MAKKKEEEKEKKKLVNTEDMVNKNSSRAKIR